MSEGTRRGMPSIRARRARWATYAAYAASVCAIVFVAAHLYLVLGGPIGAGLGADAMYRRPWWFLVFDVVTSILFVVGGLVALAIAQTWGRSMPRRLLLVGAWSTGVLLALRGGVWLAQDVYLGLFKGARLLDPTSLFDLWFLIGGMLLGATAWLNRTNRPDHRST